MLCAASRGRFPGKGEVMPLDLCRQWFGELHGWLFQGFVLPFVQWSGLSVYTEDAFDGTEEFLFGALQVLLLAAVLIPLERRFPRERWQGYAAVQTDVIYTLLHRLGLFPLFFFFAFRPLFDRWESWLHFNGWPTTNLETWWPALDYQSLAGIRSLSGDHRFRKILDTPRPAPVRMVVGAALAASQPAADDVLDR